MVLVPALCWIWYQWRFWSLWLMFMACYRKARMYLSLYAPPSAFFAYLKFYLWQIATALSVTVQAAAHAQWVARAVRPPSSITVQQPCPTRRPRYTFLAPSVSTLFEPIININSNFKTKDILECLSTVKYFHIIIISSSSRNSTY
jgi:hypothetical protein